MPQIKFSEDLINNFLQLQSELTDNAFTMGDLCVNVCDEYGHAFAHADILRALAKEVGGQYDTFRDRERVARAIPRSARMQFPLSFHQWRACLSKKSDPLLIAEWAVSGDKIATVNEIRAHVGGDDTPLWEKLWKSIQEKAEVLISLDDAPPYIVDAAVQINSVQHPPLP